MPLVNDDTAYPVTAHGQTGARLLGVSPSGALVKMRDASLQTVTANYTLQASDDWQTILVNSASDVTITVPNSLPAGFWCGFARLGAGNVTFAAASGGTLQPTTVTKLAAQYSQGSVFIATNSGSAPLILLGGDLA